MGVPLTKWKHEVREIFAAPSLRVLTIFITNRCNAKCGTCFYWQNLNTPTDVLSLDEYARVAEASGPIPHLLFSGGEPTMAHEIVDVAKLFIREPHQTLTMPTNGIVKKQVLEVVTRFCEEFPRNRITVGVSFDGLAETHDRVRGVPKNFEKSMKTLEALCELRTKHPNLRLTTLTVILKQNAGELPQLLEFFDKNTDVDYVTVEPLRGQKKDMELGAPSVEQVRQIQGIAWEINERKLMERNPAELTVLMSHIGELYRTQQEFYETQKLNTTCRAGEVTAVLEPNGDVRSCELLGIVENVRQHGYSIPAVLATAKAQQEREMIRRGDCACTHCVNIGHSLAFDRRAAARRLFRQKYLAWQLFHSPG